jgi:hypothetical protein
MFLLSNVNFLGTLYNDVGVCSCTKIFKFGVRSSNFHGDLSNKVKLSNIDPVQYGSTVYLKLNQSSTVSNIEPVLNSI